MTPERRRPVAERWRAAAEGWRSFDAWPPYVPVVQRRHRAAREVARLTKAGRAVSPVVVEGRAIARTFWGKAWCENLESYGDFANRLPRGRTYVRNGSVIHLEIAPGTVSALVSGTDIYTVAVNVSPVPKARWRAICRDCTGAIDSLVELLQGRFSRGVMERLCQEQTGLFPSPREIVFECSCPDWASMCKHVAAVLYGVGARLDERPELLFALRRADQMDLIAQAGTGVPTAAKPVARGRILDEAQLTEIFGIELAQIPPRRADRSRGRARKGPPVTPHSVQAPAASPQTGPLRPRGASAAPLTPAAPQSERPSRTGKGAAGRQGRANEQRTV